MENHKYSAFINKEDTFMSNHLTTENKMGTMPVTPLLITMSFPIVISMLVQAMYNIVDSYFVAKISEEALTAVSLAFPVQNLMISIAVGTGIGINALLSRNIGEKKFEQANKVANNGLFLAVISYILTVILGILLINFYFSAQTDIAEVITDGTAYTKICTVFSLGLYIQICCERLLQATGKTIHSMLVQAIGAITNIILDPILIFGLFGMPAMGIEGAAYATVIGQSASALLGIYLNITKNKEIGIKVKGFKPNLSIIKNIYSVGIPSILMRSVSSITIFGMNNILLDFSSTATAVMGIYYKLESFVVLPVFGINNAMIPIVAYNYGAKKKERIIKTIKVSVIFAVLIMGSGFLALFFMTEQILTIFNASKNLMDIGVLAVKIISLHFILAGICIVFSAVFQALGKGTYSLIISLIRQLVILLPVAFLLSKTGELSSIWWAFPISEIIAILLCVIFMVRVYKKQIKNL